jgi:hypothetical protein
LYNVLIEFGEPMKLVWLIKMCLNAMYSKPCIGKHVFDNFPTQSGLKQDALLPLFFSFPLAYANRKVQESQVGLKLNAIHQLLVYVDDVNLLGDNINTIKKNRNFYASKEVGLKVNAEKIKYVLLSVTSMQGKILT